MDLKKMTDDTLLIALFARVSCLLDGAKLHAESAGTPLGFYQDELARRLESLRAENAVMRELCEAQIDYDSSPSQSANRLHAESTREATERRRKALEAYRAMEGKR